MSETSEKNKPAFLKHRTDHGTKRWERQGIVWGQRRRGRDVGSENVSSNQGLVLVVRVIRELQKKKAEVEFRSLCINSRKQRKAILGKLCLAEKQKRYQHCCKQWSNHDKPSFGWGFTSPTKFIYIYTGSNERKNVITRKNNVLRGGRSTAGRSRGAPQRERPLWQPRPGLRALRAARARLHFPPLPWRL